MQIYGLQDSEPDENPLSLRLSKGCHEAFDQIYKQYHEQLFFLAKKYVKKHTLAEDAVQDVFIKLWNMRETIDPSRSVKGLLFTMLKNHVLNMVRDEKRKIVHELMMSRERPSAPISTANPVEDDVIYQEYNILVKQGMRHLSEGQRRVFEMRAFGGLSNSEVSDILNIAVNTVKVHYYHSSKFIKSYLKKHSDIQS